MRVPWRKTAAWAAVIVGVLLCVGLAGSFIRHEVHGDNGNLAECAERFLSADSDVSEMKVYDSVTLGKERFVVIEYRQDGAPRLGIVRMKRGVAGRYRIESIDCGGDNFYEEVVETNYQKYYLFCGHNDHFEIAKARVVLEGRKYTLEIPEKARFLVCAEIDYTIWDTHSDLDQLIFYDEDGRDITDQVPWN